MPTERNEPRTLWVSDDVLGTDAADACHAFLADSIPRLAHFAQRAIARGGPTERLAIVVLEIDDSLGSALADRLMPGYDWQAIRDRGETPVGRGLVMREGIEDVVEAYDPKLARAVREVPAGQLPVVIVAGGTIAVSAEALPVLGDPPCGGN